ncbi:MAG: phage tail tip lysozyme [Candidatus Saccharimonadales bacterium]
MTKLNHSRKFDRIKRASNLLFAAFMLILICVSPLDATAMSEAQRKVYNNQVMYFDHEITECTPSSGATPTTTYTAEQKIGQLLWVGFDTGSAPLIPALVETHKLGGVFFLSGGDTSALTKAYFEDLNTKAGNKLAVASDDEGGRVALFAKGEASAGTMAGWSRDQVLAKATEIGKKMADAGLTSNLAPVLDISTPGSPWGDRDWSSNPSVISDKAGAFAEGLNASSIKPVYKHFPGIGKLTANTDLGATAQQDLSTMADDLKPYQDLLGKHNGGVMLSNGYVKHEDPDPTKSWDPQIPVSMNPAAVKYLRETLKFSGLITTDALNSFQNKDYGSKVVDLPTAVANSLNAGVDMPLFVLDATTAGASLTSIIEKVKATVTEDKINTAYQNSLNFRGITSPTTTASIQVSESGSTLCCNTGSNGNINVTLSGKENGEKIAKFLMDKGWSAAGAAGAVGSFRIESFEVIKPNAQEGGKFPLGGWGIAQWTQRPGRRDNIEAWVKKDGLGHLLTTAATAAADSSPKLNLSPEDNDKLLQSELNFLWTELENGYKALNPSVSQSTDPVQAARDFERIFEGCSPHNGEAGCDIAKRINYAKQMYAIITGGAAPPPTGEASTAPSTSGASSNAVTCSGSSTGGTGNTLSGDGTILKLPAGGVGQEVFFYNQGDERWKKEGNGYNYGGCACGQTSTATILATLKKDTSITPVTVYNALGDGAGSFNPASCSGSIVGRLASYMKQNGMEVEVVQSRGTGGLDPALVFRELQKGRIMLVHTKKWIGYTTKKSTEGHYLVLYGATADGQNFYVSNPGSKADNDQAIPASGIHEWLDEAYVVYPKQ